MAGNVSSGPISLIDSSAGSQGFQGAQGAQGSQGHQGTQGAGAQGAQGAAGAQGTQGPQGQIGTQGAAGAQGTQGLQGVQGSQGSQGSQGAQGSQASITAAAIEATFTAAGQLYAGTGNGTGELLAVGAVGTRLKVGGADSSLLEWTNAPDQFAGEAVPIPSLIAQSCSRVGVTNLAGAIVQASGDVGFCPIYLYEGQVIGHLAWCSGTTAANGPTHQWLVLCDSTLHMLAQTADQTSAAVGADTFWSYAIALIASGASASYTVPTDGFYYIGLGLSATVAIPSQVGVASELSSLMAAGSSLESVNDTTGNAGPPAFPHQFTNSGALAARTCWFAALT